MLIILIPGVNIPTSGIQLTILSPSSVEVGANEETAHPPCASEWFHIVRTAQECTRRQLEETQIPSPNSRGSHLHLSDSH